MEKKALHAIMNALENTSIKEVEITNKDNKFKIVRKNVTSVSKTPAPAQTSVTASDTGEITEEKSTENTSDVLSKWVGFFYRGKGKGDKPLIKLRDVVKSSQQLGSIVSMNVVHQVISELDGKIVEVLVEDGHAVQYGQPIFRISNES